MNRYKPVGWRNESTRHYLAAKGIKTKVDFKKYSGVWRQKEVYPEPGFQRGCTYVKAEYTVLPSGEVKVVNTCKRHGKSERIEGVAKSTSPDNRDLDVQFGKGPLSIFLRGKYRIVDVDGKYQHAVVRGGDGTVWVLEKEGKQRRYKAYAGTYTPADMPVIAGDAVGTVGAESVSLIPIAVPALMLYGGAVLAKKTYKKTSEKKLFARKRDEDLPSAIEPGERFMEVHVKRVPIEKIEATEDLEEKSPIKVERLKGEKFHTPVRAYAPWATPEEAKDIKNHEVGLYPYSYNTDPSKYVLVDGHHRLKAAMERGDKDIVVKVYKYPYQYKEKRRSMDLRV